MCCGNSILQKGLPFFYLHKIFYTLANHSLQNKLFNTIVYFLQSSPDSCVKCYTMFLQFLLIKIDVFS
ncbi:hypothetical protein CYQ62_14065 [Enterococcus faecium]|nr:hypothetical protein CYQ62_14065 [Enterococcus faecium]